MIVLILKYLVSRNDSVFGMLHICNPLTNLRCTLPELPIIRTIISVSKPRELISEDKFIINLVEGGQTRHRGNIVDQKKLNNDRLVKPGMWEHCILE